MEWEDDDSSDPAFIGVKSPDEDDDIYAEFMKSVREDLSNEERETVGDNNWWPYWAWVHPEGDYWDDLNPYRSKIIAVVEATWNRFYPVIERLAPKR